VGHRAGLDGAENLVPTGIRSQTVQPGSSVAIPTELPGPRFIYVVHTKDREMKLLVSLS